MDALAPILIPLLAYFAAVQLTLRFSVHPSIPALIAAVVPFTVTITTGMIRAAGYGTNLLGAFSIGNVLTVIIQFLILLFVFSKITKNDHYSAYLSWVIGGYIVAIIGAPYIVQQILTMIGLH